MSEIYIAGIYSLLFILNRNVQIWHIENIRVTHSLTALDVEDENTTFAEAFQHCDRKWILILLPLANVEFLQ